MRNPYVIVHLRYHFRNTIRDVWAKQAGLNKEKQTYMRVKKEQHALETLLALSHHLVLYTGTGE